MSKAGNSSPPHFISCLAVQAKITPWGDTKLAVILFPNPPAFHSSWWALVSQLLKDAFQNTYILRTISFLAKGNRMSKQHLVAWAALSFPRTMVNLNDLCLLSGLGSPSALSSRIGMFLSGVCVCVCVWVFVCVKKEPQGYRKSKSIQLLYSLTSCWCNLSQKLAESKHWLIAFAGFKRSFN